MRKILRIFLIIIVTCACIALGIHTRYINGINVTRNKNNNTKFFKLYD